MPKQTWQDIVASSLDWEQAHVSLETALKGLDSAGRARRPKGYPHSVWQLLDHIRVTQQDLLDFCTNRQYTHELKWPDDYWPSDPAPESDAAWNACLEQIDRDRAQLARFTTGDSVDLTQRIPHGTGQTYLRTVLVAVDHAAYHLGQIVDVRRLNGDWPAEPAV